MTEQDNRIDELMSNLVLTTQQRITVLTALMYMHINSDDELEVIQVRWDEHSKRANFVVQLIQNDDNVRFVCKIKE